MLKQLVDTGYSRIMILLFLLFATACSLSGQSRKVIDFNGSWWFKLDSSQQYSNGRKEEGWRKLDLYMTGVSKCHLGKTALQVAGLLTSMVA